MSRPSRAVYEKSSFIKSLDKGFWDALQGVASFVGLGDFVRKGVAGKEYKTPADAADIISDIVTRARNLSDDKINQLQAKFDALPFVTTPTIKNAVAKARKDLTSQLNKARSASGLVEARISKAQGLVDDISSAGAGSYAVGEVDNLINQAKKTANEAVDIAKDPSQYDKIIKENISNEQKV